MAVPLATGVASRRRGGQRLSRPSIDDAWPIVVIGAGPAGAVAAKQAAERGERVLLVDRRRFPRPKVCGCCLNRSALATLASIGLGDVVDRLGGVPLQRLRVHTSRGGVTLPLPGGAAVSRDALDTAIVEAAVGAGVTFVAGQPAKLIRLAECDEAHRVRVGCDEIRARVLVVADGLGGRFLEAAAGFEPGVAERSYIGLGAVYDGAPGETPEVGCIQMVCGRGGYVGMVRIEDGRVDVAAAFDPGFVRLSGGPAAAAAVVLAEAGRPAPDAMLAATWRGTAKLTRRRSVAARRLFVVGDAAGYVEPFTGEGIAWAIAGGEAVARIAVTARSAPADVAAAMWTKRHRELLRRRQRWCRLIAAGLRRPAAVALAVAAARRLPRLAGAAVARVGAADRRYAFPAGTSATNEATPA
jgi:flavin-dependent dehydrogenase